MEDRKVPRILVIEDEPDIASAIERLLKKHFEARVEKAPNAQTARRRLAASSFDIVTLDYQLPDSDGLTILREIVREAGAPAVIMVTGHGDEDIAADALRYGASGYVQKDRRVTALLVEAVKKALLAARLRKAEEELGETRDFLESLLEYANAPIIVWDPDLHVTRFNRAFERLSGYRSTEVIGKKLSMLFPEDSREASLVRIAQAVSGEFMETVEIPILRQDGQVRLVLWNSANIYDQGTDVLRATIAQGQDISEQKLSEEALERSLRDYRELVETANSAIIKVGTDGIINFANPFALEFFGYSEDEIIGRPALGTIIPEVDSEGKNMARMVDTLLQDPESFRVNLNENVRKNGERVWLSWSNHSLRDAEGEVVGTLAVGNDITELRRVDRELARYRTDLEKLVEERTWELERAGRRQDAINKVLLESISCQTIEEVGSVCLSAAGELTDSSFGFIGLMMPDGTFDEITVGRFGPDGARIKPDSRHALAPDTTSRTYWGRVLADGEPLLLSDLSSNEDDGGMPHGHPPVESFLGVPLLRDGTTAGVVALANSDDEYTLEDLDDLQALAATFVEVLDRKRLELELKEHIASNEKLVEERTAELKESERLLGLTQRLSGVGGWEFRVADEVTYWTDETYRIHAMARESDPERIHDRVERSLDCYEEPGRSQVEEAFRRCVAEGVPYDLTVPFTDLDHKRKWVRTTGEAVWEDGRIDRVIGTLADVTEVKEAEGKLM